jgi:hypothetical protein
LFFGFVLRKKETMATSIGIMDSAYFVGRNEILTWINNRLQLNLSRIEEVTHSHFNQKTIYEMNE